MPDPVSVLFVCTANIARSAYAARRARGYLPPGGDLRIDSAGTYGLAGQPMSQEMSAVLTARGGDPGGHLAQRVSAELVAGADLVLTMEAAHRAFLLDEFPAAAAKVFTLRQFAAAVDAVPPEVPGRDLVAAAFRTRPPAGVDVADPYRRGAAANAATADEIDGLLAVIVPRLAGPGGGAAR